MSCIIESVSSAINRQQELELQRFILFVLITGKANSQGSGTNFIPSPGKLGGGGGGGANGIDVCIPFKQWSYHAKCCVVLIE